MVNDLPTSMVIFGASGDLTQRKLIPALLNLCRKGRLPADFRIVGVSNANFTDQTFLERLRSGVEQFAGFQFTQDEWQNFARRVAYLTGRISGPEDAKRLDAFLAEREKGPANRLFYLATPPVAFEPLVTVLGDAGLLGEANGWRRVVIEKPFGTDLASARQLNQRLHRFLQEDQIYRIDHYLGKETVQNILVLRFANAIFEPLWSRNYIDHVQISVAEKVGLEHRASYYDTSGVLRDMFQNHLLQLLALVTMEPPASFNANALRNEKVKVFSALRPITEDLLVENTLRGQYKGYQAEEGIASGSTTPTYAAVRAYIDNWRWQGVPFYLRSGKYMANKFTEISIQFKCPPVAMFPTSRQELSPNILVMCLQPDEGFHLRFETKIPDTVVEMRSVDMEFHYRDSFGPAAIPEAYERLLLDALQGDASLFTRADEVELAWAFIDPILAGWKAPQAPPLQIYDQGSCGPAEAESFIARDGGSWMQTCEHAPSPSRVNLTDL